MSFRCHHSRSAPSLRVSWGSRSHLLCGRKSGGGFGCNAPAPHEKRGSSSSNCSPPPLAHTPYALLLTQHSPPSPSSLLQASTVVYPCAIPTYNCDTVPQHALPRITTADGGCAEAKGPGRSVIYPFLVRYIYMYLLMSPGSRQFKKLGGF